MKYQRFHMRFFARVTAGLVMIGLSSVPLCAQRLGQGSAEADLSLWRVMAILLFLLVLVSGAWILVKMRGRPLQIFRPVANRRIEILEVARLSVHSSMCLIRFDGTDYLVAVTPQNTTIVEKKAAPASPEASEA